MNIIRPTSLHFYTDDRVVNSFTTGAGSTTNDYGAVFTNSVDTEKTRKSPATGRSEAISVPHKKQIMESSTIHRTSASFTGENSVRNISVVPPKAVEVRCAAHPRLQEMPDELLLNIFSRLNLRDIVVIKSTFEAADRVVNNILSSESRRWFSLFSPLQQAKFNKIAKGTDAQVLRTWLGQFTEDEKLVKYLLENRHHRHFPELLFYSVSQLMAHCQAFKVKQVVSIEHNGYFKPTNFSDDGNHMLTLSFSGQCKIYALSPDGHWVEKTTLCHDKRLHSVEFTDDGKHVLARSIDRQTKIYALSPDGNWIVESKLPQGTGINYAKFSPDGRRVAIIVNTNILKIFGRGTDGAWAEEDNFSDSDSIFFLKPSFNRDGNELMVKVNKRLFFYCRGSNGRWEKKATLAGGNPWLDQFSPNGSHMATIQLSAETVKIFGRDANGNWTEQAEIHPKGSLASARFSANSRYMVISSRKTTRIYHLAANGSWIKKAMLEGHEYSLPATFSFDGRYLAIPGNDDTVKLCGLGADGQCTEKTCIDRADCAFFSTDGNHIFAYHRDNPDGNIRFYGLGQDGKLALKATFDHGQPLCSATISPTGRYLVTCGNDAKAKIWLLCTSTENEPGSQKIVRQ